jgi:hypothetical protein
LFLSDAAVCEMNSLVELDILVSLICLSWVARMVKSVSKLMVWLLTSSRVSEGQVIRSQKLSIGPEVVNLGSSLEILKGDGLRCNSSVFVI